MKSIFISLLLASFIFSSCQKQESPLLTKKITKANLTTIATELAKDNLIDLNDLKDFKMGLGILGQFEDSLIGKTVNEIIDVNKNRRRTIEVQDIENTTQKAMMNYSFKLNLKSINKNDNEKNKLNVASYEFTNSSDKTITNFRGFVNIYAKKENMIVKRFPINFTAKLEPGSTVTQNVAYTHDPTNNKDVYIRTNQKNLIAFWFPEELVFDDETKLLGTYKDK